MSKKNNKHWLDLPDRLESYCDKRNLEYNRYSPYHMRLMDGGFTVLDCWTTARYWVMTTDYLDMLGKGHRERGGEKGWLPLAILEEFLDELFFPESVN